MVFTIRGKTVTAEGNPIQNLRVAVVDEDPVVNDLLGVGFTNERGVFRLSFTEEEFNQDLFEHEKVPDIYVVFSIYRDGEFIAVGDRRFKEIFPQTESGGDGVGEISVALGDITIQDWKTEPVLKKDIPATPGKKRDIKRLNFSGEVLAHCLVEVVPFVETLTGWRGLLEDINIYTDDSVSPFKTIIEMCTNTLSEEKETNNNEQYTSMPEKMLYSWTRNFFLGLYDPISQGVFINRKSLRSANLDYLKVVLGHELVHVGQFKYTEGLREEYIRGLKEVCLELNQQVNDLQDNENLPTLIRNMKSLLQVDMTGIEGYAFYIQKEYLEKKYNLAMGPVPHQSVFTHLIRTLISTLFPHIKSMMDTAGEEKTNQYIEGIERYRGGGNEWRAAEY